MFFFVNQTSGIRYYVGWRTTSDGEWQQLTFFSCSWDGEDRKWSSLQGPTCSEGELGAEGLQEQPRICSVVEAGEGFVCVCAGVGARQGGVPDPSTLPSKLMQL